MSHSYWRVIAAIGCLTICGASAPQEKQVSGREAQNSQVQTQPNPQQQKTPPAPPAEQGAQNPERPNPAAQSKASYDERNLQIQRRVADYTEQSVKLTRQALDLTQWAVKLTAIEALLFIVTTVLTFVAVAQAKRSADIAERALEAANRPHIVIKDIQVNDLREVAAGLSPGEVRFFYEYGNYGSTIGWIVKTINVLNFPETQTRPRFIADSDCIETHWPVTSDQGWGSGEPGSVVEAGMENIGAVLNGTKDLYALGLAIYTSPSGKEYRHRWAYKFDMNEYRMLPWHDPDFWEAT